MAAFESIERVEVKKRVTDSRMETTKLQECQPSGDTHSIFRVSNIAFLIKKIA